MVADDFEKLLNLILQKVVIVPTEVLLPYRKEALKLVKEIDINDVLFVACALSYNNSVIWSEDKKLKTIKQIRVLNTKEIIELVV